MNALKKGNNKDLIAEALVMAISFFNHITSGDFYDNRSKEIKILPNEHKRIAMDFLRLEFLMN